MPPSGVDAWEVKTMLEEINISGLGVIESSTLELGPGLTVITGETGAGKTMVVTALGLLLGGRCGPWCRTPWAEDRSGRRHCLSDADLPKWRLRWSTRGDVVEEDRVVLARTVAVEGRSRAFVGGASVPVSTLGDLASPLVAVHGQSEQHRLLKASAQRDALDRYAGEVGGHALAAYIRPFRPVGRRLSVNSSRWSPPDSNAPEKPTCFSSAWRRSAKLRPVAGEDVRLGAQEATAGVRRRPSPGGRGSPGGAFE